MPGLLLFSLLPLLVLSLLSSSLSFLTPLPSRGLPSSLSYLKTSSAPLTHGASSRGTKSRAAASATSATTATFATSAASAASTASSPYSTLVIGSGVTGSTLAFHLHLSHSVRDILVCEKNIAVGGNCVSRSLNVTNQGVFVFDQGPNSLQPNADVMKTVAMLGINDQVVLADGTLPRFVYWDGDGAGDKPCGLHALPTNLPQDLFSFNLLTWPGRMRAAMGALGMFIEPRPNDEENVKEFVTRHLGHEAFERIIAPFISGVYAGDPEKLCMSQCLKKIYRLEGLGDFGPGLLSGGFKRYLEMRADSAKELKDAVKYGSLKYGPGQLMSFKDGLQTYPKAIESYLNSVSSSGDQTSVKTDTEIKSLTKEGNLFKATLSTPKGLEIVYAKTVAFTSPASATATILGGEGNLIPAAARLKEIYQPTVASVVLSYPNEAFRTDLPGYTANEPLKGFGILFPRDRGVRSLGMIFNTALFPNRSPKGYQNILVYIGGTLDPQVGSMEERELLMAVDADVRKILLKKDFKHCGYTKLGSKIWNNAIPQYYKSHKSIMEAVEIDEKKVEGLFVNGNWRSGVAFGDCVKTGVDDAKRIADYLKNK